MANEDYSTLPLRKLLIAIARSCIGAHYLRGGNGEVPIPNPSESNYILQMIPNRAETVQLNGKPLEWGTYFTAKNSHRICSGKHGHSDVEKMPQGDGNNSAHLVNPDFYKWKRVVVFNNVNPLWGESCVGKQHFDCTGFVKWCIAQVLPEFRKAIKGKSIAGIRKKLTKISDNGIINKDDLCVADILIRKNNGHIAFAVGEGQRVIQAEWEQSGVVETDLQKWDFHGRIPKEFWLNLPEMGEYEEVYTAD